MSPQLTVTYTAGPNLNAARVAITNRQDGAAEVLAANTAGTAITASYNAATGVLDLTGTDTVANYQRVLRTVTYNNTRIVPDTTARTITFRVSAGTVNGDTATSTVQITLVNNAPVLDNSLAFDLTPILANPANNPGNRVAADLLTRAVATRFTVADLPAGMLGAAYAGARLVQIDADAARHGWFVDATPLTGRGVRGRGGDGRQPGGRPHGPADGGAARAGARRGPGRRGGRPDGRVPRHGHAPRGGPRRRLRRLTTLGRGPALLWRSPGFPVTKESRIVGVSGA